MADSQYNYCASGPPAVLFACLFLITFGVHCVQAYMFRKKFSWVICMATIWEVIGFVCRAISTVNQLNDTVTSEAVLFVLLAPLWLNAFDYIVFGRMIYYYLPEKSIAGIKAEKIATMFVLMDILYVYPSIVSKIH